MSDDALAQILARLTAIEAEIASVREELSTLTEDAAAIQREQLKHRARLDDLERRIPRGD